MNTNFIFSVTRICPVKQILDQTHLVLLLQLAVMAWWSCGQALAQDGQTRPAKSEIELRSWLENMLWYHRYSPEEMQEVSGLSSSELTRRLEQYGISDATRPPRPENKLLVQPYPGGRHPRIGFLEGAVNPQRETKLSVFCPWDETSYAVVDAPEAIWSNLGLTYLAHTHIDTIWSKQSVTLEQKEWTVLPDGNFELVRKLPNGIEFGVKVQPLQDHLRMKMWLTNGTDQPLSDLRVQNCVMLKGMSGFEEQTNDNKLFQGGFATASSPDKSRWIITGWDPQNRAWGNARCPCLHSDPKFPDCAPGETKWLRGWFSFYQGADIEAELRRIDDTGWRTHPLHHVTGNLVGQVVDATTGKNIPARLYVQNINDNSWHFARSTAVAGSAIVYDKQTGNTPSVERHTTLSADGFQLDLPPGSYRILAVHGKEFLPAEVTVDVSGERVNVNLKLQRFVDMAKRGWYSGDTHVHRRLEELPNVILAEDLNVALPLSYWVRDSTEIPATGGQRTPGDANLVAKPTYVDEHHVIYPVNTEYEIFSIDHKRHTQGAVFVLNHKTPLQLMAPPVRKIAAEARKQGGLLDFDKHSWNWSIMIVPLMNVDLFELSNNHHWRTGFGFPKWTLENAPADWPEVEIDANGFTERGWTNFGFQTYYALLNCGYRMRVTGGTASGVHPVPLGHGRVYVHTGEPFSYETWIEHLNLGHSFVTQGPLVDVRFNGELPGTTWSKLPANGELQVSGSIDSIHPVSRIELIKNGEVVTTLKPSSVKTEAGSYHCDVSARVPVGGTCWIALRCYESTDDSNVPGKEVFAHTNPVFIDVAGQATRPRRRDVEYFIQRMDAELARNQGVLSDEALAEYAEAKSIYAAILAGIGAAN